MDLWLGMSLFPPHFCPGGLGYSLPGLLFGRGRVVRSWTFCREESLREGSFKGICSVGVLVRIASSSPKPRLLLLTTTQGLDLGSSCTRTLRSGSLAESLAAL